MLEGWEEVTAVVGRVPAMCWESACNVFQGYLLRVRKGVRKVLRGIYNVLGGGLEGGYPRFILGASAKYSCVPGVRWEGQVTFLWIPTRFWRSFTQSIWMVSAVFWGVCIWGVFAVFGSAVCWEGGCGVLGEGGVSAVFGKVLAMCW